MLSRHKVTYVLVFLAIFLALTPSRAFACRGFTPSFWDAYTSATTIFTGKIIHIERKGDLKVSFQVLKVWKGPKAEKLVVMTAGSTISCGFPFEEFESNTFLLYAYGADDQLSTHIFSRTVPLSEADADLLKLNIITNPVLIVLISVIIGLAVTSTIRYFRKKRQDPSKRGEISRRLA